MPSAVKYEVYAFINDRWVLDTSFKSDQRERAIDEAQQLAKRADVSLTKVIRETFDTSRERMKETTVYRSDRNDAVTNTTISSAAAQRHAEYAPAVRRIQAYEQKQSPRQRNAGFHKGQGGGGATTRPAASPVVANSPFAVLVYKIVLIGITSFAFASFTTWVVALA